MDHHCVTESFFSPIRDDNEDVERTCAVLCIYSGELRPDAVTQLLRISPTSVVAVGERGKENRLGLAPVGKINAWFLSSEQHVESKDLRRHLSWLIGKLHPVRDSLATLQQEAGVCMYVSCPWWSRSGGGGPSLWPEQMLGLAELNLECTITFADYSVQAVNREQGKDDAPG